MTKVNACSVATWPAPATVGSEAAITSKHVNPTVSRPARLSPTCARCAERNARCVVNSVDSSKASSPLETHAEWLLVECVVLKMHQ
jgi:hypothetical protein